MDRCSSFVVQRNGGALVARSLDTAEQVSLRSSSFITPASGGQGERLPTARTWPTVSSSKEQDDGLHSKAEEQKKSLRKGVASDNKQKPRHTGNEIMAPSSDEGSTPPAAPSPPEPSDPPRPSERSRRTLFSGADEARLGPDHMLGSKPLLVIERPIPIVGPEFGGWCSLCGFQSGWAECGACSGTGGYVTKPGRAGVSGVVGWARCKTCYGRTVVPCLLCGIPDPVRWNKWSEHAKRWPKRKPLTRVDGGPSEKPPDGGKGGSDVK